MQGKGKQALEYGATALRATDHLYNHFL